MPVIVRGWVTLIARSGIFQIRCRGSGPVECRREDVPDLLAAIAEACLDDGQITEVVPKETILHLRELSKDSEE